MSHNDNNNNNPQRMGDLFQQRRAAAAASSNHGSRGSSRNHSQHHQHHRGGGGGGRRGGRNQQQQFSQMPLEQGVVCTLKESFGFVHCADRPEQVFFHYSQLAGGLHPADLQMDDEVEFRIGPSQKDHDKLACYQVRRLPAGQHIEWETVVQDGARGLVEKRFNPGGGGDNNSYNNRSGGGSENVGTIRVLVEKQPDEKETTTKNDNAANENTNNTTTTTTATDKADGPLVKFGANDYNADELQPASESASRFERPKPRGRLNRGDLVEFTMVKDRRTQDLYARHIKLLLSEKERARQEEEARMLSQATLEQGVITSLKGEYGFLRSNKRREEVYFHYSSIELEDDTDNGESGTGGASSAAASDSNAARSESGGSTGGSSGGQLVLKEGQDMKFLVVTEPHPQGGDKNGGGRGRPRISARRVKMEPRGSVKFHDLLATGVVGKVSIVPQPQDSGHALETKGRILLGQPLKEHVLDESMEPPVVKEVYLSAKDSPGGSFPYRGGSSVGLWIEVGDMLLFDVVKDFADGACRAVPTKHLAPRDNPMDLASDPLGSGGEDNDDDDDGDDRAIRLLSLTLASRAEGTVNAVKDMYGFAHFAERPVDAHFKLFQMLPDVLQNDLRRNMGLAHVDQEGNPLQLEVGAEVQFDMSVHGSIQSHHTSRGGGRGGGGGRQGGGGGHAHERENLKAQRVLLLPPGTLRQSYCLAKSIRGCVSKDNPKQPYSGTIDLDEAVKLTPFEDRHPLVARMIDEYLASDEYDLPLVYHDVQSAKEDDTVIEMIERRGQGKLTYIHIPQSDQRNYAGRLCITKIKEQENKDDDKADEDKVDNDDAGGQQQSQEEAKSGDSDDGKQAPKEVVAVEDDAAASALTSPQEKGEKEAKAGSEKETGAGSEKEKAAGGGGSTPRKKKQKTQKPVKVIRFDKSNLSKDLKEDMPPGIGDIVEFDIIQSRRTGQCHLENMKMIERKPHDVTLAESSGFGIVKEVVSARKFGFISVVDEFEMLFFNLANVSTPLGASSESSTPTNKKKNVPVIRKGDEVKFEIATEKGGKRVALNVTVLPKGTIPSKADKNACRGFVLMEPSHTSLKNTPIRHARSNVSQSSDKPGRWDSFEGDKKQSGGASEEPPITEQGCILLLEDPSGMFDRKVVDSAENKSNNNKESSPDDAAAAVAAPEGAAAASSSSTPLLQHLRYKTGAIAVHGSGSSCASDESSKPRRGDMVSFVKSRKGGVGLRDIRIVRRGAASSVRGRLEGITLAENGSDDGGSGDGGSGVAKFVAATDGQESYEVALSEVVSCDPAVLKEKESVEGILYEGAIYGICRTSDLYLESKVTATRKERPKLNLTVRKDRGGTIMAQSMMAKGPDEKTNGFAAGWTSRMSAYVTPFVPDGLVGTPAPADPVLAPDSDPQQQPESQN